MTDTLSLEEQGNIARDFVVGLVERFSPTADVRLATVDEDTIEIQVSGDELGLLIGPKGQTLAAVQELTRTIVQRRAPGHAGRVVVDVAGYRQRRRAALERFTRQIAAEVLETGAQKVLEPMGSADRKVVHDTVNELEGVRTVSEGEEPYRRVVIMVASSANSEAATE